MYPKIGIEIRTFFLLDEEEYAAKLWEMVNIDLDDPNMSIEKISKSSKLPKARFSLPLNQMLIDNLTSRFLVYPYILFGFGILVIGVAETIATHWITGGIFLFIAGFLFATFSGTEIDTDQRLIREYNCWFGLFKTGRWLSLDNYPGVTLVSMNKVHRMFSQSNRVTSYTQKEFRIYLLNASKKPAIALKRCKTYEQAQKSVDEFSVWLHKPVFSIKK